jgi:arylsulfatase
VAYLVPHFPLQAMPEDIARCKDRYKAGWDAIRAARWKSIDAKLHLPGQLSAIEREIGPPGGGKSARAALGKIEAWHEMPWDELTPKQQEFQSSKMAIHAAMVERMDHEIGRLVEQLRAMNAYDDTLVLFLSDNGASAELMIRGEGHDPTASPGSAKSFLCLGPGWSNAANTPFRRHKQWVHEGGIATPLIAHWPAKINAHGELRTAVGHVIDIAPTIMNIAGGTWPPVTSYDGVPAPPGKDLTPTFTSDLPIERDGLWWLHNGNRAIREGDWKLVAARDEPWELFNLVVDRAENNNLVKKEPGKARELSQQWESMLQEFESLTKRRTEFAPQ